MERFIVCSAGAANYISGIVEPTDKAEAATQCAQIRQYSVVVQVRMEDEWVIGDGGFTSDLTPAVDAHCWVPREVNFISHESTSQSGDIFHDAVVPKEVMGCRYPGIRIH